VVAENAGSEEKHHPPTVQLEEFMFMKHALILGAFVAITMTACGKKEEAAPPPPPPAPAAEPAPAPAPEAATSAPEAAPTAAEGEKKPE
jgi:hypothetical protein